MDMTNENVIQSKSKINNKGYLFLLCRFKMIQSADIVDLAGENEFSEVVEVVKL